VEAISVNYGTGGVQRISLDNASLEITDFDKFIVDLRIKPSNIYE